MLELLEERRNVNGWRRPIDPMAERRPLTFELLVNRISCNSATFSIYRAKIPGGWLVAMRPHDQLTFIPDPQHQWDGGSLA
ncbi:MAG: hypothetical protein ABSE56_22515 [Bryobacteraceae bacterium]|jgi:hypothetical protein